MSPYSSTYGIFSFFFKALSGSWTWSYWSLLSCLIWNSVFIALVFALSKIKAAKKQLGTSGIILLYMVCTAFLYFPIDARWQRNILLPESLSENVKFLNRGETYQENKFSLWKLIFIIWGVTAFLLALRMLFRHLKANLLIGRLPKTPFRSDETTEKLIPKGCKANFATGLSVPISRGFFKREILIPDKEYTETQLANILRHESVHIRKRDHICMLLTDILCSVYWWHPLIYLLKRDMEKNVEIRADLAATKDMSKEELAEYMKTLLVVFKGRYEGKAAGGLGMLGNGKNLRKEFRQRFAAMTEEKKGRKRLPGTAAAVVLAAAMILTYTVVFTPYYLPEDYSGTVTGGGGRDYFEKKVESADDFFFVSENSYLIRHPDGTYELCTPELDMRKTISEQMFETFLSTGLECIEE